MSELTTGNSSIVIVLGCGVNAVYLARANRLKLARREEILAPYTHGRGEADDSQSRDAWIELGDKHPDFPYTL